MNSITEDSERSEPVANDDHSHDGTDPDRPRRSLSWSYEAVVDLRELRQMAPEEISRYCGWERRQ